MIRQSIRRKILAITLVLILLMAVASVVSLMLVRKVDEHFDQLTGNYIPAYGHLAQANIRSLERAVYLRQMVIEKFTPGTEPQYEHLKQFFIDKGKAVESEISATRERLRDLIENKNGFDDDAALARIDARLDDWLNDQRPALNRAQQELLQPLEQKRAKFDHAKMVEVDAIRETLNGKINAMRTELLDLISADTRLTLHAQQWVSRISVAITLIAGLIGLLFSILVSNGIVSSIRQLLEGAQAIEAGKLDHKISVLSSDEIGHLSQAFNQMVEQLRVKERIRATFGTYVDPRVVEGLISGPTEATEGQRRIMTVLFCDLGGFSRMSEQLTPQALVRVVNRYFTIMSAPVRENNGIIDKYIGDAIMAYWGAPFNDEKEQAHLAMRAALDMCARVEELNIALGDELGLRETPVSFDIRIGVATGEVIVGSIGSEQMKNFTVIGDTVNIAARLESIGKSYGVRALISDKTALEAADEVETRELDCVYLAGQQVPHAIYEIMGAKGALSESRQRLKATYADALAAYREQDWSKASELLNAALRIAPNDGPSRLLLDRIAAFRTAPPAAGWQGVWRFDQK